MSEIANVLINFRYYRSQGLNIPGVMTRKLMTGLLGEYCRDLNKNRLTLDTGDKKVRTDFLKWVSKNYG